MTTAALEADESPQHLKQVSRVKHIILQKYLPSWERILGSKNCRLCYFDCYAGPGVYEFQGQMVDGSPIIAVRAAQEYLAKAKGQEMTLILVEKDDQQRTSLETELKKMQAYGPSLQVHVMAEDVKEFVPKVLGQVPNLAPSFFMVDPYGHPLTVPILNDILKRPQTEALINFMYYRINMDAGNPKVQHHLDEMFSDDEWRTASSNTSCPRLMHATGSSRSKQKSELHSTTMALVKLLLCRNLGLRYVRAKLCAGCFVGITWERSESGANLRDVQTLLGHKSLAITARYTHVDSETTSLIGRKPPPALLASFSHEPGSTEGRKGRGDRR